MSDPLCLTYKAIKWWPNAFHVFNGDDRIGIVNCREVREGGKLDRIVWYAHNRHFFTVKGEWSTRTAAANAIPTGAIHQDVSAFSGHA